MCTRKLWKGTTGHSQGIVASVIISISETEEAFIVNSCKMLKYLFWQGLRLQDNFNEIQSAITQFIPEPNAEIESQLIGKPTPLLAILGLPYEVVKKQVDKVNLILSIKSNYHKVNQLFEGSSLFRPNIEISLINGPRAIVCSGSPSILPVFVKSLQSIQAKVIPTLKKTHLFSPTKTNREFPSLSVNNTFEWYSFTSLYRSTRLPSAVVLSLRFMPISTRTTYASNRSNLPCQSIRRSMEAIYARLQT